MTQTPTGVPSPSAQVAGPYIRALDGLRCFAVAVVVWQHTGAGPLNRGFGRHGVGVYGVWLFFVLSGFLITGILLREKDRVTSGTVHRSTALRRFYARRFLRIFPAYYLLLALLAALPAIPRFREDLVWYLTYLANWQFSVRAEFPVAVGHLWSLAVEEQFYLAWPALILLLSWNRLPRFFLATALLGVVSRIVVAAVTNSSISTLTPTLSNLDSLALGALLAWHFHVHPNDTGSRSRWTGRALVAGLALIAANAFLSFVVGRGFLLLNATEALSATLVSLWLLNRAASGPTGMFRPVLEARPIVYVGRISYGVYLYHLPLAWGLRNWSGVPDRLVQLAPVNGPAFFVVVLVGAIGLASLSWYLAERPINRLKDRFPYA